MNQEDEIRKHEQINMFLISGIEDMRKQALAGASLKVANLYGSMTIDAEMASHKFHSGESYTIMATLPNDSRVFDKFEELKELISQIINK